MWGRLRCDSETGRCVALGLSIKALVSRAAMRK